MKILLMIENVAVFMVVFIQMALLAGLASLLFWGARVLYHGLG